MADTLHYQRPEKRKPRPWKIVLLLGLFVLFLAATIIIPMLNRLRNHGSHQLNVIDNLHQIGLGILLYSNEHGGQLPGTLSDLILYEQLSPEVLIDPASNQTPATGSTPQAMVAEIAKGGHQTFIYLGAGLTDKTADATTLIAYEPLTVYHDGSNVLFGDGHSEWLNAGTLKLRLAERSRSLTTRL